MTLKIAATQAQAAQADALLANLDKQAALAHPYTTRTLSGVKPERVAWLWLNHLPRGKSVGIIGEPDQGKSTVADDIVARVTTGAQWPDGAQGCEPSDVILMCAEDGLADTVVPRLKAAGADLSRVHSLDSVTNKAGEAMPPMLPEAIPHIERAIMDHRARLLVVDVLMGFLSGEVNSYKDQDVRAKVMTPLTGMLERTGCTALLLRHLNKTQGGSALSRAGGSIGITGAERAEYVIASDPADPDRHIMAPTKFNLGRMPKAIAFALADDPGHGCARVHWLEETGDKADQLVNIVPESEEDKEERSACHEFIISHLEQQGGEDEAKSVLKAGHAAGFDEQQLKDARRRCRCPRVVSKKSSFGSGWVWAIEDQPDDSEGGMKVAEPHYPHNVPPSHPSTHSNDSRVPPSYSVPPSMPPSANPNEENALEGAHATKVANTWDNKPTRPPSFRFHLETLEAGQRDGIIDAWGKQLAADLHALDRKLADMTPTTLELLSERGGGLKRVADMEYTRRSGIDADGHIVGGDRQ